MAVQNVVVNGGRVRFTPSGFAIIGTATATLSANSNTKVQKGTSKAILQYHGWSSVVSNSVSYTSPPFTTPGSGFFRASSVNSPGLADNMKSGTQKVVLDNATGNATFTVSSPAINPANGQPDTATSKSGSWSILNNGQNIVKLKSD